MIQKLVKDVMTRDIVTVSANVVIDVAIDLMLRENVSGLPVVDSNGDLLGLITEYDVLCLYDRQQTGNDFASCKRFMTRDVQTIQQDAWVQTAAKIFKAASLRRLLVVDGKRLVGILSRRDVLRCIRESRSPAEVS